MERLQQSKHEHCNMNPPETLQDLKDPIDNHYYSFMSIIQLLISDFIIARYYLQLDA